MGRYTFTHQNGKDVKLSTKDIIKFADTNSQRAQIGVKLSFDESNKMVAPYISETYEYEFSATADAKIDNLNVEKPSMKGGSAIAGIGLTAKKAIYL
ncbi:MAG: autotransporter domain-containing protein [Endomicrobium sp.]|nr:autotransporter domain-containing protein [Endomicrobium sp.]